MLRNRHFLLLWIVNVAATLALELLSVTILVTIFQQTDSTLQAAGTMVARTLPAFLLGPVAGVLVDRFPRKWVLVSMDLLRISLVVLVVRLLAGDGEVPVISIYLILACIAAAGVFHRPARLALIPSLVSQPQIVPANSLILASNQIVLAISYTLGGWLILAIPLRQIALLVVAIFSLSVLAALLISVPPEQPSTGAREGASAEPFWRALVSGWRYLRHHPIARPLTIMETVEHLPHGIWTGALMLAFTNDALAGDPADWGYMISGYFAGMIVGSLASLALSGWLRRYPGRIIIANACASGLLTLIFANSPTVWIAVAWAFVFGPPSAMRDVAQDSLLQSTVEGGQLGRVYATREMLRSLVFMFAGLFFAWLSERLPIRLIYVTGGFMYLLTGLYALSRKSLRDSQMKPAAALKSQGNT